MQNGCHHPGIKGRKGSDGQAIHWGSIHYRRWSDVIGPIDRSLELSSGDLPVPGQWARGMHRMNVTTFTCVNRSWQ